MALSLMVDLETLGHTPTAAVSEIGAVLFDPESTLEPLDEMPGHWKFYEKISLESCLSYGLTVDASTLAWWLRQGEEQQHEIANAIETGVDIKNVFRSFTMWVRSNAPIGRVWSHGASFDIPILENISKRVGYSLPWQYVIVRDTRTLFDLAGYKYTSKGGDKAHNALADAYRQALAVQVAWKKLKGIESAKETV